MSYLFDAKKLLFPLLLLSFCISCTQDESTKLVPVVRVGEKYLYQSDIQIAVPNQIFKDSLLYAESFIDNWVSRQVFIQKAHSMLSKKDREAIEAKVLAYKEDLMVHAYKIKALETLFSDTIVSQEDIKNTYQQNERMVRLSGALVRVIYVFLDKDSNLKNRMRKILMDIRDPETLRDLKNISHTHSKKFNLFQDKWFTFYNLKRDLPFLDSKKLQKLNMEKVYLFSYKESIVYCYFLEIIPKGEVAPMAYVKDKLKTIIINRRKLDFIKQLKRKLYKEIIKGKDYEIFIKR